MQKIRKRAVGHPHCGKIKVIEESGTKIVPMSEELRQEVRDASKGVTEEICHSVSKDIVDAYLEQ